MIIFSSDFSVPVISRIESIGVCQMEGSGVRGGGEVES